VEIGPFGSLFVAGSLDNRVVMYATTPPTENQSPAILVFGQPTLYSSAQGNDPIHLNNPNIVKFDSVSNALWVSDWAQSRIVRYSIVPVWEISALPVVIQFQDRTPNVAMLPKGSLLPPRFPHHTIPQLTNAYNTDPVGQTNPGETQLLIQPAFLEETAIDGHVVANATFTASNYSISTSIDANNNQIFVFSSTLPIPVGLLTFLEKN